LPGPDIWICYILVLLLAPFLGKITFAYLSGEPAVLKFIVIAFVALADIIVLTPLN